MADKCDVDEAKSAFCVRRLGASVSVKIPHLDGEFWPQRNGGLDFTDFYPFECPQTGNPLLCRKSTAAGAKIFCVSSGCAGKWLVRPAQPSLPGGLFNGRLVPVRDVPRA